MIHFNDVREVLNILRDVQAYIFMQAKNDELGKLILSRIEKILIDNDELKDNN